MCAASHSCCAFRSGDDKNVNVDENNVDFVLCVDGSDATTRLGLARRTRAMYTASHSCHTFRSVDDKEVNVDEKTC